MRHSIPACVFFLNITGALAQQPPTEQQPSIAIQVVEGDSAINSIRFRRAREPLVRVVDANGEPLSAATVSFLLPATGPSGTFGDSGLSLTVQTDARGLAAGRGLRPNGIPGQFRIRVTASAHGSAASATLVQTNAEPVVRSGRTKKIAILAVVAVAIAGGAAAAASAGKSNSASPGGSTGGTATGGSISAGAPSLGPPH